MYNAYFLRASPTLIAHYIRRISHISSILVHIAVISVKKCQKNISANSFFAKVDAAGFGTELAKEQTLNAAVDAVIVSKTAANNQQPDLSKFVPIAVVSGLQAQIATLTANSNKTEIDTLYTAACSNGQLLGDDMQAWGRKLADEQPEEFKKFVGSAPKIAALNGKQTDGTNVAANKQQGQGNNQFTPEDLAVAAAFGHSLES